MSDYHPVTKEDPPHCSTCPHFDKFFDGCKLTFYKDSRVGMVHPSNESARWATKQLGCLSHPDARAYLMADVIEELERLSNQSVGSQYEYALEDAIALIKGVK